MMVGLPGSGKSLRAKFLAVKENAIIHSSDTLRQELFGDENTQDNNEELFKELHRRIKRDLKGEQNVIYDATNISYKRRKVFLEELKKINCEKICYLVATPYEKCLDQNKSRERQIPEYVIKKMYLTFCIPQYYEGWDEIKIIWNDEGYIFDTHELFYGENGLTYIEQDNPNHTLTIGNHCLKCYELCTEQIDDIDVSIAALYHDIGKRFTKQFKNSKGEDTDIAHYYQHHLVSAYDSMFYLRWLDDYTMLKVVKYIQWHMQPFFIKTDKAKNKLINLIGQTAYEKLLILHKADKLAK